MKVIGFANKYYTLWEVNVTVTEYENYSSKTYHNTYIKNISIDKNKVIEKYPTISFDENLKGKTHDFDYKNVEWKNIDTFRFGNLEGTKIELSTDFQYIALYYSALNDGDHRDYVLNYLLSAGGYVLRNNELLSPAFIAREQEIVNKQKEIRMLIDNHKSILFKSQTNVNDHCEIYDGTAAITYVFQKVSLQSYNGYQYYLPVLNGVAKRIKNKVVEITDYMVEETEYNQLIIHIKNFKINK